MTDLPAWATIVLSLVGGVGGGALAAVITSRAQHRQALLSRRDAAAAALWTFERSISDWSGRIILDDATDDWTFTKVSAADVAKAREAAYVYMSFLPPDKRHLVQRSWFLGGTGDPYTDKMDAANDAERWASALRDELEKLFPESS